MSKARIRISSPAELAALLRQAKVKTADPPPRGRSKYRAQKATYRGLPYDSRAEAAYAAWLDREVADKAAGRVLWWVKSPTFHLGCPENRYRPDFLVVWLDPYEIYLDDVKGKETPKFRHDCKLWRQYGPTTLRVVKLNLNYGRTDEHDLPSIRKVDYINIPGGLNP